MATLAQPRTATTVSSLGGQANTLFAGAPANTPFLPQILQPIPDPIQLKSTYESLFPQNQDYGPYAFFDKTQAALAGIPKPPTILAPQVQPVQVAFPQGGYQQLADAQYQGQFLPVQRELERREALQGQNLQAQLAQTGLADSGTGIGQQQQLTREYSEQLGAASSAIAGQAQARALEAQLAVATQQANIDIQANLANAQLDYGAQQANARNILERGAMEAQAYTAALGLDAQVAEQLRGNFIQFIDSQTKAALGQSEVARAALADIFNAILQQDALELRTKELQLAQRAQTETEAQNLRNLDLQNRQLGAQTGLQSDQNRIAALGASADIFGRVAQGNEELGTLATNLASYGGVTAPYETQDATGRTVFSVSPQSGAFGYSPTVFGNRG